jgi:hypothetical protein
MTETHVMHVLDALARTITAHLKAAKGIPTGIHELPEMRAINALADAFPSFYEAWAARSRDAD